MFRKILVIISVALSLFLSGCSGDEWDRDWRPKGFKTEYDQKAGKCDDKEGFNIWEKIDRALLIYDLCNKTTSTSYKCPQKLKCWMSCMVVEMGMAKVNGKSSGSGNIVKFIKPAMQKKVESMRVTEETSPGFFEILDTCADVAEKVTDKCDCGYEFVRCVCSSLKQKQPEKAPRQGEGRGYNDNGSHEGWH